MGRLLGRYGHSKAEHHHIARGREGQPEKGEYWRQTQYPLSKIQVDEDWICDAEQLKVIAVGGLNLHLLLFRQVKSRQSRQDRNPRNHPSVGALDQPVTLTPTVPAVETVSRRVVSTRRPSRSRHIRVLLPEAQCLRLPRRSVRDLASGERSHSRRGRSKRRGLEARNRTCRCALLLHP